MQNFSPNATLVIIDVQQGFDDPVWGKRNNPNAEKNIAQLLHMWRTTNRPVVHVQHLSVLPSSPLHPDQIGCEFKVEAQPLEDEFIFPKTVNSAFIGTSLESYLRQKQIETLVIAGLTTDHCVSMSTRMAANLGFEVWLVLDGTATFERTSYNGKYYTAEEIHESALASLHNEFATVVSTSEVIAMLNYCDRISSNNFLQ